MTSFLRPVYTGDFCRGNSMQFLSRRSCNFKIARVNQLRFQRDFSAIVAAMSQEFRTCSKLDAILRRFLTKLNHKGPLGRFCYAEFQFVFVWSWLIQTLKKTCIRLCFGLRRGLAKVLVIHKQAAAATAKSSSIFMLIY